MVDKSKSPCLNCSHEQKVHGKHFAICFECLGTYRNSGFCKFKRLDNLPYLEWVCEQKESKDE